MIVSRTPLRISFVGGGTDFAGFYKQHGGCVISAAIDKYIYVVVKDKFDKKIRVSYSKTEIVDDINELQHDIVKECMRYTGVDTSVEICTLADVPSEGTGLGSSSALTVGLLNALYIYRGIKRTQEALANEACHIEIDILGKPIGKQDQYGCAIGGVKFIEFYDDESVFVDTDGYNMNGYQFSSDLLLFYTGITRDACSILTAQTDNINSNQELLIKMRDQVYKFKYYLNKHNIKALGDELNRNWQMKKQLTTGITNEHIGMLYNLAINAGAIGGKITGAGGGGFLLFVCPYSDKQHSVRKALADYCIELPFEFDYDGTCIILNK